MLARRGQDAAQAAATAKLTARLAALEKQVKGMRQETRQLTNRLERQLQPRRPDDPDFRTVVAPVLNARRTLLGSDRLHMLWQAVSNVAPLGLPAVEIGTYRGGSAYFLAAAHRAQTGQDLELYAVDTFSGHDPGQLGERDHAAHAQDVFLDTDVDSVRAYLAEFPGVHVIQGAFPTVAGALPEGPLGLVHLDVDVYAPMLACLDHFVARTPEGAVVIVDDYGAPKCPGVEAAVAEHLAGAGAGAWMPWNAQTEQLILVRR
jgi:hypothetical protein